MDAKVKKLLKATRQENMNQAIDFASDQRKRVNQPSGLRVANDPISLDGRSNHFAGFLKKDK